MSSRCYWDGEVGKWQKQMMNIEASKAPRAGERVHRVVRERILSGEIRPSQILDETALAEELEVSRTPLREALHQLAGEGLVRRVGGAWMVRELGVTDYFDVLEMRKLLEGEAGARAASRMSATLVAELRSELVALTSRGDVSAAEHWTFDDLFHDAIAEAAGNEILRDFVVNLRTRARMCSATRISGRFAETCREHLAILDAIASGDANASRRAMWSHVNAILRNATWLDEDDRAQD